MKIESPPILKEKKESFFVFYSLFYFAMFILIVGLGYIGSSVVETEKSADDVFSLFLGYFIVFNLLILIIGLFTWIFKKVKNLMDTYIA